MSVYAHRKRGGHSGISLLSALLLSGLLALAQPSYASSQARDVPDLSGNWIRGDFVGLGQGAELDDGVLTEIGKLRMGAYDFRSDDPAYGCVPASWTRVWSNPNVVVRITQPDGFVRVQYEWMDIDRRLPVIDPEALDPERVQMEGVPTLGRSMAWYDGDALVVDTIDYAPGYITTIANLAGLPQSRTMRTVERIRRDGDRLNVEITHLDPTIFREAFVMSIEYVRTDYDLLEYDCDPELAGVVEPE